MSTIEEIEILRLKLETAFNQLLTDIPSIKIGNTDIFPLGWRNAAKGRTVWRILEEAIVQNLERNFAKYGLANVKPAETEVGVVDLEIFWPNIEQPAYINIKSAVQGGRTNKDDISKAKGLIAFHEADQDAMLFVVTIEIAFAEDMSVSLKKAYIMPTAWLPDLYVNPSNNGNLQSSKYKDINACHRRSTYQFLNDLKAANEIALAKKALKKS